MEVATEEGVVEEVVGVGYLLPQEGEGVAAEVEAAAVL